MSHYSLNDDYTAFGATTEFDSDFPWLDPSDEDFDFPALLNNESQGMDASLLETPSVGQDLGFSGFLALQPGHSGFQLDQSDRNFSDEYTQSRGACQVISQYKAIQPAGATLFMNSVSYSTLQPSNHGDYQETGQFFAPRGSTHCIICFQMFQSKWKLECHAVESKHQTLICPFKGCHQSYFDKSLLRDHVLASQHGDYCCEVQGCDRTYLGIWELEFHARAEKHRTFKCIFTGCSQAFTSSFQLSGHESHSHSKDHYPVQGSHPLACIECGEILASQAQLQAHANIKQHSPFQCVCGSKFARVDVLHRHMDAHGSDIPKHPCNFCKRHRGRRGFKRRDHLVQHLRGYHNFDSDEIKKITPGEKNSRTDFPVCPYVGCDYHRDDSFFDLDLEQQLGERAFKTKSELTKHLKQVHDESPFPCNVRGCDKIGGKGYVRQKDLMKHRAAKHPEVDEAAMTEQRSASVSQEPRAQDAEHDVWAETVRNALARSSAQN